jgi:hypothetical protein
MYAEDIDPTLVSAVDDDRGALLRLVAAHGGFRSRDSLSELREARGVALDAGELLTMTALQRTLPRSFRSARRALSVFLLMVAQNQETGEWTGANLATSWAAARRARAEFAAEDRAFLKVPAVSLFARQFDFVEKGVLGSEMDRANFVPTGLLAAFVNPDEAGAPGINDPPTPRVATGSRLKDSGEASADAKVEDDDDDRMDDDKMDDDDDERDEDDTLQPGDAPPATRRVSFSEEAKEDDGDTAHTRELNDRDPAATAVAGLLPEGGGDDDDTEVIDTDEIKPPVT